MKAKTGAKGHAEGATKVEGDSSGPAFIERTT